MIVGRTAIADPVVAERLKEGAPLALELLREPFATSGLPGGGTRADQVAANVVAALFARDAAGEPGETLLGRGVGGVEDHPEPGFRAGVDDHPSAALAQLRDGVLDHQEGRL